MTALPLPALDVPEHQDQRGEQQRNEEERDGRAAAEVPGLDADLVREHREDLARVGGTALGQQVHDAQIGQREHGVEQEPDHQDREDHRRHDVAEALEERAAIDLGGVEDFQRDRGEAGQQHDRAEREGAPHVDRDAGGQRQMRLAEPDGPALRAVAADQPGPAENPVDHAELRVVHPLPREHADRDGQRERDDDEDANELLAPEDLEEEEREGGTEEALTYGGYNQERDD